MLNILLLLFFLACVGITGAWIAENPGSVTIYWFDYRIDTSFAVLMLAALLSAVTLAYAYIIIRRLISAPDYFSNRRRAKFYEKGLVELTYAIAALAASDVNDAGAHTRKAEKLLGRTPLTLLLSAQVARSQGDEAKTQILLEQMLDYKETEYLAARSLSDSASKKNLPSALALAQRAHALNPQGIAKVISLHIRLSQWQQAILAVDKATRKRTIARAEMQHYKGIILLQQGLASLTEGNDGNALAAARLVLKYVPTFTPAVVFAAKAFAANAQQSKAISLLTRKWKQAPDALLAEAFLAIIASDPKEKQMKRVRTLIATQPKSRESDLLLAQFALSHRDWATARKAIKSAQDKLETTRSCKLMAELEQGEYSDFDASGRWLARSADAINDPAWICSSCGTQAVRQR